MQETTRSEGSCAGVVTPPGPPPRQSEAEEAGGLHVPPQSILPRGPFRRPAVPGHSLILKWHAEPSG